MFGPDPELTPEEEEEARKSYLLTRFWISARGFWGRNGDRLAWRAGYITVHRHDLHAAILEKVEPDTWVVGTLGRANSSEDLRL